MKWLIWDRNTNWEETQCSNIRRTGNSTRIIDWYIQKLFTLDKKTTGIEIVDESEKSAANRFMFDNVLRRLQLEHPYTFEKLLHIDLQKGRISWK